MFVSQVPNFKGKLLRSKYSFQYHTEYNEYICRACRNNSSFWPRGKMLGGSGSVNAFVYLKGSEGDYAPWRTGDDDGWDWPTILKYFSKSEKIEDPYIYNHPELLQYHGTHDEYLVDKMNFTYNEFAERLATGYVQMGLDFLDDLNGPKQNMGVGLLRGGVYNGERVSPATAFLNPVRYK